MNMKKILTLLLFYLISDCLIAQISNFDTFFQSPEVSALTKEVQTPVSLSSGTLGIDIPLHELRCGDIKVPISLSYDATGIRAETHPTWVGLNWNLKAGGKITRVVKGEPDEKYVEISQLGATGYGSDYGAGYFYNTGYISSYLNYSGDEESKIAWIAGLTPTPDLQPDEFVFNFCGQSGVFYANTNGEYVVKGLKGYTIESFQQLLPWNPIRDNGMEESCFYATDSDGSTYAYYKISTYYIMGFKVVDPNGFTYYFGINDPISNIECYTRNFSEVETSARLFDQFHTPEINAWHLMKIVSPTGHTVTFEYQPGPRQAQLNKQFSYNDQWFDKTSAFFNSTRTITYPGSSLLTYEGNIIRPSYLKRIVSDAETVEFTRTPTQDLTYDFIKIYNNLVYYKLLSDNKGFKLAINSWDGDISSLPQLNNYIYPADWLNIYPTYYAETYSPRPAFADNGGMVSGMGYYLKKCLFNSGQKLDSIHISAPGASGKDVINFTFDYIDRPTSRLQLTSIHSNGLPMYEFIYNGTCDIPYASGRSDHWGYINSNDINSYPDYFENYFNYNDIFNYNPKDEFFNNFYQEREPNNDLFSGGYLKAIKYPTGGTKEFVFEPNAYDKIVTRNAFTGDLSIKNSSWGTGGGFRIAKIIENDTKSTTTTSYEYSGGILNGKPQYCFSDTGQYYTSFNNFTKFHLQKFISSSIVPVSINPDFSSVTYSKVIEKQEGNGRVEYTFSNHDTDASYLDENSEDVITYTKTPYTPLTSRVDMRGKLLEKKTFKEGDNNTPVKDETFSYELLDDEYIRAVNLHVQTYSPGSIIEMFYDVEGAAYRIYTAPYVLEKNTEQYVYPNGSASDTTAYTYDDWYQIATKTNTGSGNTMTNEFKYPYNYYDAVYRDMVSRNMIAPVIEQITTRNGNVIAAQRTDYAFNGLLLPSSTYSLNTASPVSQSSYSQYYSKDLNFDRYDSLGNILQYTGRDSVPITYLWSYSSQYPIAKIINATYDQVKSALGYSDDQIESLRTQTSPDVDNISNLLHTNLPNAQVATYTYKPLVGMTTETDPRGVVTYYDYDDFGRLKKTYFYDNNDPNKKRIVKYYDYHYKN